MPNRQEILKTAESEKVRFLRLQFTDILGVLKTRVDPEGVEIGHQQHVRLLDADEALDRRAVEHDLAVERLLELKQGCFLLISGLVSAC